MCNSQNKKNEKLKRKFNYAIKAQLLKRMQNKLDYWINHWINHWLMNKLNKQNGLFYYPTSKKRCMPTKFPKLFIDGITLERENQIIYSLSSTKAHN